MALSVPVAISIGLASVLGVQFFSNSPMLVVAQQLFVSIDKFPLVAIPFFILSGNLMEAGGISERLVHFARSLVGGVQGGLAMSCVRHLHDLRGGVGLERGHHLCHRRDPDPGHGQAGLSGRQRGGVAGHRGRTGRDHSAVDPDDPVRRVGRSLGG